MKKSGKVKFGRAAPATSSPGKTPEQKRRNRGTGHLADMDAKKVIKEMLPLRAANGSHHAQAGPRRVHGPSRGVTGRGASRRQGEKCASRRVSRPAAVVIAF